MCPGKKVGSTFLAFEITMDCRDAKEYLREF